jgi:hypothetical protein
MPQKEAVSTDKAPPPMPFFSQAIKCQGMVYCSGSIGMDPATNKLVEGSVGDRTVLTPLFPSLLLPSFPPSFSLPHTHLPHPNTPPLSGTIPPQPLSRPHCRRQQHRQRSQSERVPRQHGELRGDEQSIRGILRQRSKAGADVCGGVSAAAGDGCRD